MNPSLQQLLQRPDVWRPRERRLATSDARGYATGFSALDRELHSGGWPRGALTELLLPQPGIGELQLLLPLLADLSRRQLLQVWINPPFIPYAPALAQHGIAPDSLLIVRSEPQHLLWACEQALRSAATGAVLYWPARQIRYAELRKLQVAAATQNTVGFLLREADAASHTSPAALRLHLSAATPADHSHLSIQVLKQRGSTSGQTILLPRERTLAMPMSSPAQALTSRRQRGIEEYKSAHAVKRNRARRASALAASAITTQIPIAVATTGAATATGASAAGISAAVVSATVVSVITAPRR